MTDLSAAGWVLAAGAAVGVGVSKSGFPGMALVHVMIFAFLFGARDSTGVVLPMLIAGDLGAIGGFYPHTRWDHLRRTLPAACLGVVVGAWLMGRMSEAAFAPTLGWIILILTLWMAVDSRSARRPAADGVPAPSGRRATIVAGAGSIPLGLLAGMTTMLANAGGPVMTLYLLAMKLPKLEFTATVAWFFFVINVFKIPFSVALGLITMETLALNAVLLPGIAAGLLVGRWLIDRVPQRVFNQLLLAFAGLASLRLIGLF
jgi:uncharacterized membrane protein YfcA